jgi:hypothetical protein
MLQFRCPHCGGVIRLKGEFAGRQGSCPHCKKGIRAPARPAAPPPPKPEPAFVERDQYEQPKERLHAQLYEQPDEALPAVRERSARGGSRKRASAMPFIYRNPAD